MKSAQELAHSAIVAKEHNADCHVDGSKWFPVLVEAIEYGRGLETVEEHEKWLAQSVPHPTKDDGATPGELLILFGLIENAKEGIIWNA